MTAYATQAGPKNIFSIHNGALIRPLQISKFTQFIIMCLCGCSFEQSWADLWTQLDIVGVDFKTHTEIGTPT
jgi:hypothetical protein